MRGKNRGLDLDQDKDVSVKVSIMVVLQMVHSSSVLTHSNFESESACFIFDCCSCT